MSTENSFDEESVASAVDGPISPPLSRSTSSSSFTRRSWTELKADSNISDEEFDQQANVGNGPSLGMDFSENDSTFGAFGCDFDDNASDQFKRNLAKLALFGIILAMVFGKSYIWSTVSTTTFDEMREENVTKLRTELDRIVTEKWEFELKLVQLKEQLEAERTRRYEVEKKLWKAHEQLEMDLDDRVRLQTELDKMRAELMEAEQKTAEAEREADNKWMGGSGGLGALNKAYRTAKQAQWARGNLRNLRHRMVKETSEWWVPLYWRVLRVTFFKER